MTAIYQSRELADAAAEKLKVYAQPQRLMILSCLLGSERTVGEIDTVTNIGQPALSQQLAELRRADMVKSRRASKQIYYSLADDTVALCIRSMEAILASGEDRMPLLQAAINTSVQELNPIQPPAGTAQFVTIMK